MTFLMGGTRAVMFAVAVDLSGHCVFQRAPKQKLNGLISVERFLTPFNLSTGKLLEA